MFKKYTISYIDWTSIGSPLITLDKIIYKRIVIGFCFQSIKFPPSEIDCSFFDNNLS